MGWLLDANPINISGIYGLKAGKSTPDLALQIIHLLIYLFIYN